MTATPPGPPPMTLLGEFRAFLDKYSVIGLAIAFIIGAAFTALVQAVVKGLLMPTLAPIFAAMGNDWRTAETYVGPFGPYLFGDLLYNIIYFLIIAAFVFAIAKWVLREGQVAKK